MSRRQTAESVPWPDAGAAGEDPAVALAARIANRSACIAIVGLGHVGLPLALAVAASGFPTLGLDTDAAKLAQIAAGRSPLAHCPAPALPGLVATGRLVPTADATALGHADAVVLCVPTPLDAQGAPDLGPLRQAAATAVAAMPRGALLVLESTTWPGTTREVLAPLLRGRGWRIGQDAFLAYAPEREDPGNRRFRTADIPKLVAGADPASHALALALYRAVVAQVVPVASPEIAEAAKLTENVFRAVNIALANELKQGFAAMGIDVWPVIEAAATKPFGFMPFWPGPGPGGHCIPVDPVYLTWAAQRSGARMPLVEAAIAANAAAPAQVLARLEAALGGLAGRRVLLLGLAYKPNVADLRESAGLALLAGLRAMGATVGFHDPLVPALPPLPDHPALSGCRGLDWDAALAARWDAALIATDHDAVDYAALAAAVPLVVDTRNALARRGIAGTLVLKA
jgi:UDP-N-acetyl-D-glucosamine dehydrogenase